MHTVAVLMSTYNGEKYIREQLNSIFGQKDVNVKLYARDDGSSDNTVTILKEYSEKYPVEILQDGENIGPGESFMRLVYRYANEPGIEYYAFADQDDIWLEDKMIVAIEMIEKSYNNQPMLYSSNQFLFIDDENKGNRHKNPQRIDLISHMTKNTIAGCTFVFNKKLAQLVTIAEKPRYNILKYRLHDSWMMLVAIVCGTVLYDDDSHMLYRIHSENVVGVKKDTFQEKCRRMHNLLFHCGNSNVRMYTASELLRLFSCIKPEDEKILDLFANYKRDIKIRIQLLTNKEIINNCQENPLVFRIKILLGTV